MDRTPDLLFEYVRDIIYNPTEATLKIEELDEDYQMLGKGLVYLGECVREQRMLANALAKGDLSANLPSRNNELAAPLKALHASLKHMTWQSQQVAKGDYRQHVDFMGEFSDAFNTMIKQLDFRQRALEEEIEASYQKTRALEQSNALLANLTFSIPQIVLVAGEDTGEILYSNAAASAAMERESGFFRRLADAVGAAERPEAGIEFESAGQGFECYYHVGVYSLQWNTTKARAFVLTDISREKKLMEYAYRDDLTNLYNRLYGMNVLECWLREKRPFVIAFADLDGLKYVNDNYGHSEGDVYIRAAASLLASIAPDVVACRVGGDEFMILIPDRDKAFVERSLTDIGNTLRGEILGKGREYEWNISFGVMEVSEDSEMPSGRILSIADERMYEMKREHKKKRLKIT